MIPAKLKSRKLHVWLVWTALAIVSLFIKDMPRETIYQFYGFVSLLYISANTAQKWIERKDNLTQSHDNQK